MARDLDSDLSAGASTAPLDRDDVQPEDAASFDEMSLRQTIRSLIATSEEFTVSVVAALVGLDEKSVEFRLGLHGAIDDLRTDAVCEFAPVRGRPGVYVKAYGMKTLRRAAAFRRAAVRKLARVKDQLGTIDAKDLPEGVNLDAAKSRIGGLLAAASHFARKRRFDGSGDSPAFTTPRKGVRHG